MLALNIKRNLVVLLIAFAIIIITSSVLANTGEQDNPVVINGLDTKANVTVEEPTHKIVMDLNKLINTNTVTNTTENTTQNTVQNTTISTYQNTSLPQTGDAGDYAIFTIIAVVAVISIYAYRKVRNYNI